MRVERANSRCILQTIMIKIKIKTCLHKNGKTIKTNDIRFIDVIFNGLNYPLRTIMTKIRLTIIFSFVAVYTGCSLILIHK